MNCSKNQTLKVTIGLTDGRCTGLGEVGNLDGVVFDNWKVIDSIPRRCKVTWIWIDFGYTNDPTAIIEVY